MPGKGSRVSQIQAQKEPQFLSSQRQKQPSSSSVRESSLRVFEPEQPKGWEWNSTFRCFINVRLGDTGARSPGLQPKDVITFPSMTPGRTDVAGPLAGTGPGIPPPQVY